MNKKVWFLLKVVVWVLFLITTVLIFYVNHYLPHGEYYDTGDVVCTFDNRGPCSEQYREDLTNLNIPDWAKFFKSSEGEVLWFGLLILGLIITSKKEIYSTVIVDKNVEDKEEADLLSHLLFRGRIGYAFSNIEKNVISKLQKKYHSGSEVIDIEFSPQEKRRIKELKVKYKSELEKYK